MFASFSFRSLFIAAASLILGAAASTASPTYVEDNGGFFSDNAKATATRAIVDLAQRDKKEVAVETFKELPADVQQGVNPSDSAAVKKAVAQWAAQQARSKDINGVLIVLVKTPPHLQVVVGTDTQKKAFTLHDRDELVSAMLVRLRAKQYDDALIEGVNFVAATMRANLPTSGHVNLLQSNTVHHVAPSRPLLGGYLPLIIGFIVVWIVIRLIGAIFRGGGGGGVNPSGYGGGYGGGPMMSGGGGGGFFSSLIGGMFGAAAGNWMYDQFSGRRDPSFGSEQETRQVDDQGYTGKDTDYTSDGGSFGDNSGGGDSGSGDSGGGDFGGGDSGGGGDFGGGGDSGGGGGDF
jgi:uncharacterized protein